MRAVITLCTDFGTRDGYVAAMKGVILSLAPGAQLVDITHEVPPQAVREAAFVLASAYGYFPPGTVHLVVVDPGVGSDRRLLAVRAGYYYFVAPDNGVLSLVLRAQATFEAVALTRRAYWREEVSHTFHGRDILAPVAAHLANGVPLSALGEPLREPVQLAWPAPERRGQTIIGHVLHIDRFGNLVTDIPAAMLFARTDWRVVVGRVRAAGIRPTYASVGRGEPLALIGSHGYLEVAVREGSAEKMAGAKVGDVVHVEGP